MIPCGAVYKPRSCESASLETMYNIEDFERCAPALLDTITREYIWSGSGNQQTLWENKNAYKRFWIKKKVLRGITNYSLETTVLGQKIGFPVGIAPTAGHTIYHPEGDQGTAKGAARMGAAMTLNAVSHTSLEDIAASAPPGALLWMHTYIFPERDTLIDLVKRAEKAGYKALVVTIDEPFAYEIKCNARHRFFTEKEIQTVFPNIKAGTDFLTVDPRVTFNDITWLSRITKLPIIVKGIMTGEDAKMAVAAGASAIYVSNHGGRELDGSLPTIEALPEIVAAVSSYPSIEVYVDGGIRSGYDVFKAIALGARAVFIGRPALWGLTMGGADGVAKVLNILRQEFTEAMIHAGFTNPRQITSSSLVKNACQNPFGVMCI
ncbi:hydroxyacid oxidase 1 [Nephila pilipes]|uniref:(S)-2-hydroxy-acid oxidase n=1 Tax=Nephila pilipes TaxID=299642 RepID=A0A8X6NB60_NEPPI|nr:hydroxyacid oxidase 1 [Nephila pilipes]